MCFLQSIRMQQHIRKFLISRTPTPTSPSPSLMKAVVAQIRLLETTAAQEPAVIRVPKRIADKIAESSRKQKADGSVEWRGRRFRGQPGKAMITAKRKEFNYYQNQTQDKFKPLRLASGGWKHRDSQGDHFTILAFRGNPSVQDKETDSDEAHDFSKLKLDQRLLDALGTMDIESPTRIQSLAIPPILRGRNVLCASETGSGKTLAYLLPTLHLLLRETSQFGRQAEPRRPRCLVLVPAWELAHQIKSVASELLRPTGLVARCIDGAAVPKSLRHTFLTPADVVVSTPGPLLNCLRQRFMEVGAVSHVVVDEVDTMLDDSFCRMTLNILQRLHVSTTPWLKKKPFEETQLVLAGATMPKRVAETLEDILPETALETISTAHLHRIMPHVSQTFLRLHSQDKAATILRLAKNDSKRNIPVLVFCNEVPSCNWLAAFLEENGLKVLRLNGDMNPEQRLGVMRSFQRGVANVLVCTDVGSRGVDTIKVKHVVNFDFPNFMSDYIHRAGRVGRVGSAGPGHVTSFVVHKWDVDLVKRIETAVRVRQDLPRVNANIKKRLIQRLVEEEDAGLFV